MQNLYWFFFSFVTPFIGTYLSSIQPKCHLLLASSCLKCQSFEKFKWRHFNENWILDFLPFKRVELVDNAFTIYPHLENKYALSIVHAAIDTRIKITLVKIISIYSVPIITFGSTFSFIPVWELTDICSGTSAMGNVFICGFSRGVKR